MAIDSRQKRMSAMNPMCPWRDPLVDATEAGTTQGNRQAMNYCYSGILAAAAAALTFVLDLNTRLRVYLADLYTAPDTSDLTALVRRNLDGRSGEMTARFQALVKAATDAMS